MRRKAGLRSRITPEACKGLKKLRHALEYLADEFVSDGSPVVEDYGRVRAIQLLASLSREIYFADESQPTFSERIRTVAYRLLKSGPESETQ